MATRFGSIVGNLLGNANQFLRINSAGTAAEFADIGNTTAQWNADKIQGENVDVTGAAENHVFLRIGGSWLCRLLFEAGTFVPNIVVGSGSGSWATTNSDAGFYVYLPLFKLCWVGLRVRGTVTGTVYAIRVSNLPKTSKNQANWFQESIQPVSETAMVACNFYVTSNSTQGNWEKSGGAAFATPGAGNTKVSFSGWYQTNA